MLPTCSLTKVARSVILLQLLFTVTALTQRQRPASVLISVKNMVFF